MKRLFLLAACVALLFGSARASVAARMEESAALLGEDGAVLVAEGSFEDIVPLGEGLFAATTDGARYALMDARGLLLTSQIYEELRLREGSLLGLRDGGWGLMNLDGGEITSFDFTAILPTGDGSFWALRAGTDDLDLLVLDAEGRMRFSALRPLRWGESGDGMLPLETEPGLWGYCDSSGRLAIPARFAWAGGFVEGCAAVVADGRYGAIDLQGAWILAPEFDSVAVSDGGFLLAERQGRVLVSATDGGAIAEYGGEDVWAALVGAGYAVCDGEALRVYDAHGALVEELAGDASVSEGVDGQLVISEGMWGERCVRLMDSQATYQNLYPLGTAEGKPVYASMEMRAARYQNDLLHEIQLSVDMDSARYGLVDATGEELLPCAYAALDYLCDDRFLVRAETQWRMIDSTGRIYWRSAPAEPINAPEF